MSVGESMDCIVKIIRILANNHLDYIGEEPYVTDKWLHHVLSMSKTKVAEYTSAIIDAVVQDFSGEEETEESDKPVDLVLAKLEKKTGN